MNKIYDLSRKTVNLILASTPSTLNFEIYNLKLILCCRSALCRVTLIALPLAKSVYSHNRNIGSSNFKNQILNFKSL
jgi:hypothetical protein